MCRVSPGDHGRGRCGYLDVVRLYSSAENRGISTNNFFSRAEKPGVLRDYLVPPVLWHGRVRWSGENIFYFYVHINFIFD